MKQIPFVSQLILSFQNLFRTPKPEPTKEPSIEVVDSTQELERGADRYEFEAVEAKNIQTLKGYDLNKSDVLVVPKDLGRLRIREEKYYSRIYQLKELGRVIELENIYDLAVVRT